MDKKNYTINNGSPAEQGAGHAGGAKPSTTPEPNNSNTIVKVIVCLFVVGIILSIIF